MLSGEYWADERTFAWRRVGLLRDRFELDGNGRTLATLAIGGLVTLTAELEIDDQRFMFTTEGVGDRYIRVSDADTQSIVASFEQRWSGRHGTVRFAAGGQLEWRRGGRLWPTYVFTDRFANPLLRFGRDGSIATYGLGTELDPLVGSWRDLAILLALGWLLLVKSGTADPSPPTRRSPV